MIDDSRQRTLTIGVLFMLALGCGTPGKNLPVTEGTATLTPENVQEIHVRVESFYFEPSRIHVTVGVPVRMILTSGTFIIPHNFTLYVPDAGLEIDQDIGHGKTRIVRFTPTKEGEYRFYCDKGGHAGKGMVGVLVVEPGP